MSILCYIDDELREMSERGCDRCVNFSECERDVKSGSFSTLDLGRSCKGFIEVKKEMR